MIVAAVLMVVGVVGVAGAETLEPQAVRLQLKSEARVPDDVLEASQQEVARIFARAGFEVIWTDDAPRFTVTITPRVLGYARASSPVMGIATRTTSGQTAQVFFRQVEDFARVHHVDLSKMLGHVIAHEVGHLLLPADLHSPTGLMRGEWDHTQMRDAVNGALTFTDGQAQRIRAAR